MSRDFINKSLYEFMRFYALKEILEKKFIKKMTFISILSPDLKLFNYSNRIDDQIMG
jgi:hypothetical protein